MFLHRVRVVFKSSSGRIEMGHLSDATSEQFMRDKCLFSVEACINYNYVF